MRQRKQRRFSTIKQYLNNFRQENQFENTREQQTASSKSTKEEKREQSEKEGLENYNIIKHRYIHLPYLQYDEQYGVILDKFLDIIDPIEAFCATKKLHTISFLKS